MAATKILIVDDNESIRSLLSVLFRAEQYDVVGELSGGDNLASMVERLQPDVILLDQEMPGKDGLTLFEELKNLNPKVVVIMITGNQDPEFRAKAASAGIAGFLRKPFSQSQVIKEFKQIDHVRRLLLTTPAEPASPGHNSADPDAFTMVIADDSALMREILSIIVTQAGVKVVGVAVDGQQAVDMAATLKPDAVCLDLDMPILPGLEALEKIKSEQPAIKIIIISGHVDKEKVRRAIDLGASGFIIKPFEAQQVIQTIQKLRQ